MSDDFFGDLGKSITRATQRAAMRTGSLIESTKINAMITAESKAIEKLYLELGEIVYGQFEDGAITVDSQIQAVVDELDIHLERISSYRTELAEVKGMKVCPSCGEIIETDALFCPKCGVSALTGEPGKEEPDPEEDPYEAEEEADDEDLYEEEEEPDEEEFLTEEAPAEEEPAEEAAEEFPEAEDLTEEEPVPEEPFEEEESDMEELPEDEEP